MKEYIERSAVMQKFADHVKRSNNSDFAEIPTWNQAVQIVEDFPAADVVEVRTGRWILNTVRDEWQQFHSDPECSECGFHPYYYHDHSVMKYCPNCGAKMDGEG